MTPSHQGKVHTAELFKILFIYLFHNSSYMQKTQIKAKVKTTLHVNLRTSYSRATKSPYADPLEIIKNKYNV